MKLVATIVLVMIASSIGATHIASAKPKSRMCACFCFGETVDTNAYDAHGLPCYLFEFQACSALNPDTGQVSSGTTHNCTDYYPRRAWPRPPPNLGNPR